MTGVFKLNLHTLHLTHSHNLTLLSNCTSLTLHWSQWLSKVLSGHTGLNTRRAFGKCSLRDDFTLEWLHFGPRRGCAACRRWALGLCWWNSTTVLNHNRGVSNSFWIKHTGLNTRRAFWKCSLRDDFTLEWLHFGMTTLRLPWSTIKAAALCQQCCLALYWEKYTPL